jgi:hypothetical protein
MKTSFAFTALLAATGSAAVLRGAPQDSDYTVCTHEAQIAGDCIIDPPQQQARRLGWVAPTTIACPNGENVSCNSGTDGCIDNSPTLCNDKQAFLPFFPLTPSLTKPVACAYGGFGDNCGEGSSCISTGFCAKNADLRKLVRNDEELNKLLGRQLGENDGQRVVNHILPDIISDALFPGTRQLAVPNDELDEHDELRKLWNIFSCVLGKEHRCGV